MTEAASKPEARAGADTSMANMSAGCIGGRLQYSAVAAKSTEP